MLFATKAIICQGSLACAPSHNSFTSFTFCQRSRCPMSTVNQRQSTFVLVAGQGAKLSLNSIYTPDKCLYFCFARQNGLCKHPVKQISQQSLLHCYNNENVLHQTLDMLTSCSALCNMFIIIKAALKYSYTTSYTLCYIYTPILLRDLKPKNILMGEIWQKKNHKSNYDAHILSQNSKPSHLLCGE